MTGNAGGWLPRCWPLLAGRARAAGIRRFTALVSAGNAPAAGLLRNMNADLIRCEPRTCQYEITLASGTSILRTDPGI
jgi:hypothetical protein